MGARDRLSTEIAFASAVSFAFTKKTADRVALAISSARDSFGLDSVGDRCFIEPRLPAELILRITWRVVLYNNVKFTLGDILFLLFGHVGVTFEGRITVYDTFHPISREGLGRLRWRRFMFGFFGFFSSFPILIGIVMLMGSCLMAIFPSDPMAPAHARLIALGYVLVSIGVLACSILFLGAMERLRLPGSLMAIGRWPARLLKIQKLPLKNSVE